MNSKKISSDFSLNIAASVLMVATTQFIVYPNIARSCDSTTYGKILTVMAVINIVLATFGNGLNNLRLITHEEYHKKNICGDFNVLLFGSLVIIMLGTILSCFYFNFTGFVMFSFGLIVILAIIRIYLSVSFRLNLDYKKILALNIVVSVAYAIVAFIYRYYLNAQYWYTLFLLAEMAGNVYLLKNTNLLKEPFVNTKLFASSLRKYGNLIYLTLTGNLLLYMDCNILYPLLGGTAVAIFFASTVVGKSISIVTKPIAGVLLSYFSQVDFVMNRKRFWKINLIICLAGLVSYIVSILLANFAVHMLYPSLYIAAKPYLYLANVIPVLGVIGSMAQPSVLRYVSLNVQSVVQTAFLLLSVGVSYCFVIKLGLWGFCYAAIILSCLRIGILWFLGDKVMRTVSS